MNRLAGRAAWLCLLVGLSSCGASADESCARCQDGVDGAAPVADARIVAPLPDTGRAARSIDADAADHNVPREASTSGTEDVADASRDADRAPADAGEIGGLRQPLTTAHLTIGAHDPSIIEASGTYYLFTTGGNLSFRKSNNLRDWQSAGTVLAAVPWINDAIGSVPKDYWAPDISYFNGKYHVYYAGSTFGSNQSAIGLATNVTLDARSPDYQWVDEGLVIGSTKTDNFNCIDPHVAFDDKGQAWMSFGSFWDGIKMRKLDVSTGKLSDSDTRLYALASRGGGAIEAPSIVSAHGYYYLFVSYDLCCKVDATYRTMVGRSRAITGPYVDAAGKPLLAGNATQILATEGRFRGPGGGTAMIDHGQLLYAHHYYDAEANGAPLLEIHPLALDDSDWIVVGAPLWQ